VGYRVCSEGDMNNGDNAVSQLKNNTSCVETVYPVEVYRLFRENCCFHHPDIHSIKKVNVKGKVHPRTGNEGPKGEMHSSTLGLSSALDGDEWLTPRPGRLIPGKRSGIPCVGGWVSHRAGLDRSGKSRRHREPIPGPPSPPWTTI